jgi:hypothetical protein
MRRLNGSRGKSYVFSLVVEKQDMGTLLEGRFSFEMIEKKREIKEQAFMRRNVHKNSMRDEKAD